MGGAMGSFTLTFTFSRVLQRVLDALCDDVSVYSSLFRFITVDISNGDQLPVITSYAQIGLLFFINTMAQSITYVRIRPF